MIRLVELCKAQFGASGSIVAAVVFLLLSVIGAVIAFRGRDAMVWLVGVCAATVGVIAGAMLGLLVFDSFIIMLITAFLGGVISILLVRYVKFVGYFIGIGTLSFFLARTVSSEMYTANTKITSETLLAIDLLIGMVMGVLATIRSKYLISLITAAAGGMITSICFLAMLGFYFVDLKAWILAGAVALGGMLVQIKIYDLKKPAPKRAKHEKTDKQDNE